MDRGERPAQHRLGEVRELARDALDVERTREVAPRDVRVARTPDRGDAGGLCSDVLPPRGPPPPPAQIGQTQHHRFLQDDVLAASAAAMASTA